MEHGSQARLARNQFRRKFGLAAISFFGIFEVLVKASRGLRRIVSHTSVRARGFLDLDWILGLARQATIGLEVLRGHVAPDS